MMTRWLTVCALLIGWAPILLAQEEEAPTETVVRLKLHPAPAPKPALKYQLLPELRETNPGNPVPGYLKCFMEQNHFFNSKAANDYREKMLTLPLDKLPVEELRNYGGSATRLADEAARLQTPDWQALLPLKREGIGLLIPEVQKIRELITALRVRLRGEIADKRFDDAVRTAKTLFAISQDLSSYPVLISQLVGLAGGQMTLDTMQEMIQQPDAPNLYWAFTALPKPLVDLHEGVQGERLMWYEALKDLREDRPMSDEELRGAMKKIDLMREWGASDGVSFKEARDWMAKKMAEPKYLDTARKRLAEGGIPEAELKPFPDLQVFLVDQKRTYLAELDEVLKLFHVPYHQAKHLFPEARKEGEEPEHYFHGLTIPADKVARAQAWLEQRLALFRVIEALRMHAEKHGGKLPVKLSDIKLPLPLDPMTGEAFRYSVEGGKAHLRGTPPPGMEKNAVFNTRYVITLAP